MIITDGTIVLRRLPPLVADAFRALDTSDDGIVHPDDFVGGTPDERLAAWDSEVSLLLDHIGALPSPRARAAVPRLFALARELEAFDRFVSTLVSHHHDTDGAELEVTRHVWLDTVLPAMHQEGRWSVARIADLGAALVTTMLDLTDTPLPFMTSIGTDCGDIIGLRINPRELPEVLAPTVRRAVAQYQRSIAWLFQYREIECDGVSWWSSGDCPEFDELPLGDVQVLHDIAEVTVATTHVEVRKCPSPQEIDDSERGIGHMKW